MSKEAMKLALKKAFQLGQDYWYQADHDSYRENKKSDETLAKFRQLVDETCEALAKPDFWEGYVPEPVKPAQQEPDWLNKEQTETDWDHVWLLIKAASYASSKGFVSGTTNWGSAVSRYMRNESPQPAQQEPVVLPCCGFTDARAVRWNFYNKVVQCHNCGQVYTSPPAQRTWVGLVWGELPEDGQNHDFLRGAVWAETKLKEKNQ